MKKYIAMSFAAILLLLGSSQVARADITSNLFGYWQLTDGSGTTAADSSGNSNTGTLTNGPVWSSPGNIWPNDLKFVAASKTYVSAANHPAYTSFTWAVWVNPISFPKSDNVIMSTVQGVFIETTASGDVRFTGRSNSTVDSGTTIPTGSWSHVAVTCQYNGATADVVTIYVNGSQVKQQATVAGDCNINLPNPAIILGAYGPSLTSALGWNGYMQEARIYTRVLSAQDISDLYAYNPNAAPPVTPLLQSPPPSAQGNSLSGWAWSSTIGWISFNSNDNGTGVGGVGKSPFAYSVQISTTTSPEFSGYAWSSGLGWISFQPSDVSGCPGGPVTAPLDINGNLSGPVTGFVRVLSEVGQNDGWDGCVRLGDSADVNQISPASATFTGSDNNPYLKGGVTYFLNDKTYNFKGFAWSNNVLGWLSFQNPFPGYSVNIHYCNPGDPGCPGGGSNPDFALTSNQVSLTPANPSADTSVTISRNSDTTTQTITPSLGTIPAGLNASITNPGNCTLNTNNVSCTVKIHVTWINAATGSYIINVVGTRSGDNVTHSGTVAASVTTGGGCPTCGGGNTGPVNLYIDKTKFAIDTKLAANQPPTTLTIKKGNPFALEWNIDLPQNEYNCSPKIDSGSWSAWTGADLSAGFLSNIDTSANLASTYVFYLKCTSNIPGDPSYQGQAKLLLQSSSESEQ